MSSAWGQSQFAAICYDSNSENFNQEKIEHLLNLSYFVNTIIKLVIEYTNRVFMATNWIWFKQTEIETQNNFEILQIIGTYLSQVGYLYFNAFLLLIGKESPIYTYHVVTMIIVLMTIK